MSRLLLDDPQFSSLLEWMLSKSIASISILPVLCCNGTMSETPARSARQPGLYDSNGKHQAYKSGNQGSNNVSNVIVVEALSAAV